MLKESLIFVLSTGVLIYLIAPSAEPEKPQPVVEEAKPVAPPPAPVQSPDDAWDYDDEEEDESFTFGEPLTHLDDGISDESDEEDGGSGRPASWGESPSGNRSFASNGNMAPVNSPKPGEKGSRENPIEAKPVNNDH
ncbi:hypothetical protein [uncultured Parasphingorhabdus sp.]|uniref:hypothetical protein n=1 Tax=uncultured Parasphingorhabdus sp. TaxID=2709694 RepID=UPI0030D97798|tara:strand:+ start:22517 stop:22927 length:411 start_codon:yes stop_codon:yes gene_type:complete